MSDQRSKTVTERFVTEMAVMIRNVAGHDWGWFSREDLRMHVQTVEEDARTGPNKAKAWLEDKGTRTFEPALGKLSGSEWKKLEAEIRAERDVLESRWGTFMIENDWINANLKGSVITLTAYPGSHNSFTRPINLRRIFPGAYPEWDKKPPTVDFDKEHGLLRVGIE